MVTGVSLSHTRGLGGYAGGADTGRMTSAVTRLYPWVGFKASERVTVWTVAGYGAGGLLLSPGASAPIETGLSMAMAARVGRGELMTSEAGFELAFKADALWVGTRTDAASGASGNLKATRAGVTRLRTALEGWKSTTMAARMAFTPSVEVGIRQDGGDAEVGRGLDVGLGLLLADGVTGLDVDVRIRRLLVHQAAGFAESGMSVSVSYDPTPKTPLGFTAGRSVPCRPASPDPTARPIRSSPSPPQVGDTRGAVAADGIYRTPWSVLQAAPGPRADDEAEGAGATSRAAMRGQVEAPGTLQWSTYRREVWGGTWSGERG